jgi:hypothetical protein
LSGEEIEGGEGRGGEGEGQDGEGGGGEKVGGVGCGRRQVCGGGGGGGAWMMYDEGGGRAGQVGGSWSWMGIASMMKMTPKNLGRERSITDSS